MAECAKNETVADLSGLLSVDYDDAETGIIAKHLVELHSRYQSCGKTALELRHRIGRYLTVVKSRLKHGEWLPWLEQNVPFSERTAQHYLTFFAKVDEGELENVDKVVDHYSANKTKRPRFTKHNSGDEFQTPPEALGPLLPYIPLAWKIWEPACGKGYLVDALRGRGHRVVATDIKTGHDFLSQVESDCDCIITNPPYSLKNEFIERCYSLGKPFALLLPLYALESKARQTMFRKGLSLLVPERRINYETPSDKWKSANEFVSCWFCHGLDIHDFDGQIRFVAAEGSATCAA